jgi:hypothetical protein
MKDYCCNGGKKKIADVAAISEIGGQSNCHGGMAILK